jgi:serine/threonine protein kinase
MELSRKILEETPAYSHSISKPLVQLLEGLLQKDSHHRFNMAKIKAHAWTTENSKRPMPSTEQNCRRESITDADLEDAFKPAKFSMSEVISAH